MKYGKIGEMKYLEEIASGEFFVYKDLVLIKTIDFRKNSNGNYKYFCVSSNDGSGIWLESNSTVDLIDLYKRDSDGNILPIKIRKNDYKA